MGNIEKLIFPLPHNTLCAGREPVVPLSFY